MLMTGTRDAFIVFPNISRITAIMHVRGQLFSSQSPEITDHSRAIHICGVESTLVPEHNYLYSMVQIVFLED